MRVREVNDLSNISESTQHRTNIFHANDRIEVEDTTSKMWCFVTLPNSMVLEIDVDAKSEGQECFDKVCFTTGCLCIFLLRCTRTQVLIVANFMP